MLSSEEWEDVKQHIYDMDFLDVEINNTAIYISQYGDDGNPQHTITINWNDKFDIMRLLLFIIRNADQEYYNLAQDIIDHAKRYKYDFPEFAVIEKSLNATL